MAILCYIVGAIVFILAYVYAFQKPMLVSYPFLTREEQYLANQNLSFLLFSMATSMVFLGPLSLAKYGVWIVILVVLVFYRFEKRTCPALNFYFIFLLWCVFAMTYADNKMQAVNMLIKYNLPILYFLLGYNSINSEDDLEAFLRFTTVTGVIYACIIGGLTEKVLPPVYSFFTMGGICVTYASLADFFTSIICIPFALYVFTQNKKYLYAAGFMMLSTVMAAVRTGIGGTAIALSIFAFIIYRLRSLPYIVLSGCFALGVIYFVPSVHDKMFGQKVASANIRMNIGGQNVTMNGREYIWQDALDHCYKGHELMGSGLGDATHYLKTGFDNLRMMHNDYITMKCEIGDLGMGLFILFAIVALLTVLVQTLKSTSWITKVMGASAVGSLAGTMFCMGFDNVVTYAQQCFVIPFVLLGIFYRCVDLDL